MEKAQTKIEDIVNNEEIKSRYVFPGNIKLPLEAINGLSETIIYNLRRKMEIFYENAEEMLKGESAGCCKIKIAKNLDLFVDYKKGRINFYLEDKANNCFTQIIDATTALDIADKKTGSILNKLNEYLEADISQKRENNLTSTLVHSAYNSKINNRGSPTVFGKKLDNDFDLDL